MTPRFAFSSSLHVANNDGCLTQITVCYFGSQSERRPSVSATERAPRLPPPAPASSLSSVLGQLWVTTSHSATNTEPMSPHSATLASVSAGVSTPMVRRSPTPALDLAALLCVSQASPITRFIYLSLSLQGHTEYCPHLPHVDYELLSATQVSTR